MMSRIIWEASALGSVLGAIVGYLPHVAALFGALYWISMFIIRLPEVRDAIQKLRKKKTPD
jgi:uncharacterized integral membrane protein